MRLASIAGGVAAAALLAAPAMAQGAEINTGTTTCVRIIPGEQTLPLYGSGFTPGSYVTFTADGETLAGGNVDEAGNVSGVFFPPTPDSLDRQTQTFQVAASDTQGVTAAPIAVPVSRIAVKFPTTGKPTRKVKFRMFGFLPGQKLYLFVRKGSKTKRRVVMGTPKGPCGSLVKRLPYLPLKPYTTGQYDYFFSHLKTFSKQTYFYRTGVTIYTTFG